MPRPVALALAAVLLLGACSEGGTAPRPSVSRSPVTAPTPSPSPSPGRAVPAAVVPLTRYLKMWKKPTDRKPAFTFDTQLPGGGFGRMLVVAERLGAAGERWLKVELPIRPNGSAAWVRGSDVHVIHPHDELVIDLSKRTLARYRDGRLVDRFRVGVGQPQYPTAVGTFYVWLKVDFGEWYGPYGIYALGLSGFSPVLSDWPGGGRMAIHGTSNPDDRGQQVSHGCIRVYNPDMETLRSVPLGTPVIIRR